MIHYLKQHSFFSRFLPFKYNMSDMSERTQLLDIISEVDGNEQSETAKNEGT